MVGMIFKKVFHLALVIFAVSTFVFWFLRISGDPVALLMPMDAQKQEIEQMRKSMGLDDPQYIQYLRFLKNLGKGDLGNSFHYKQPAMKLLVERIPATLQLTFSAMLFAIVIGIPLGIVSAVKQGTALDTFCVGLATIGQSVPLFWLGLMLMLVFSVSLGILPTSGRGTFKQLILPSITLGALPMAAIVRLLRASMLTALHMDYVTAARAKGVREFWVVVKHAFRNAAIPVVTFIGIQLGMLFGGAVVTEMIFAWPGVGRLVVMAIYNRDYPLVQATVIFLSTMFVIVNFVVDVLYSLLDPRVRVGGTN